MSPEEKSLLNRSVKLSEENNKILHKMQRAAHWAVVWGFIKVLIIVVPIVAGIIYLQPFFDEIAKNFDSLMELVNNTNGLLPR